MIIRMPESRPMLKYAFSAPEEPVEVRVSLGKCLALGYVAACTAGLIVIGIVMAMQV